MTVVHLAGYIGQHVLAFVFVFLTFEFVHCEAARM